MLPPEIICDIIDQAPFEVFCAFAKTSKGNLAYCKKKAIKFVKRKLLPSYSNVIQFNYMECLPNGKKHGISFESEMDGSSYILYDFGRKLMKVQQNFEGLELVSVYPFNSMPIFAEMHFHRVIDSVKVILKHLHCPNLFNARFMVPTNIEHINVPWYIGNNMRKLFEYMTNFDIEKYINEQRQNITVFTYKSINRYEFRLNRDQLSIDFKNGRSFYKPGQVKPKDIERIKARVEPEIFAAIRPWLGPKLAQN